MIESGFSGMSSPRYLRQIDNGDIIDISDSIDVDIVSHGAKSVLAFEKVVLTTNVTELNLKEGSTIKTIVRLKTDVSRLRYYKIK